MRINRTTQPQLYGTAGADKSAMPPMSWDQLEQDANTALNSNHKNPSTNGRRQGNGKIKKKKNKKINPNKKNPQF